MTDGDGGRIGGRIGGRCEITAVGRDRVTACLSLPTFPLLLAILSYSGSASPILRSKPPTHGIRFLSFTFHTVETTSRHVCRFPPGGLCSLSCPTFFVTQSLPLTCDGALMLDSANEDLPNIFTFEF